VFTAGGSPPLTKRGGGKKWKRLFRESRVESVKERAITAWVKKKMSRFSGEKSPKKKGNQKTGINNNKLGEGGKIKKIRDF